MRAREQPGPLRLRRALGREARRRRYGLYHEQGRAHARLMIRVSIPKLAGAASGGHCPGRASARLPG